VKLNAYLAKSTIVAALGGLLLGFDTAVIAGTTRDLTRIYSLSPATVGLTVANALWGTILGAMFAGIPGDRYGRRDSLRGLAVLYFVSRSVRPGLDMGLPVFFRFVEGIAIGGSSVLGPCISPRLRRRNGAAGWWDAFNSTWCSGVLLAYFPTM